jgi:hypothetical protein
LIDEFGIPMKRIASLSILFAALIEFAIERARFDLWIVAVVAIVTLPWNVVGRALRSHMGSQKNDNYESVSGGSCNVDECLSTGSSRTAPLGAGFDGSGRKVV